MTAHRLLWWSRQLLYLLKSSLKFSDWVDSAVNTLWEAAGDETKEERKARRRLVATRHTIRLQTNFWIIYLQAAAHSKTACSNLNAAMGRPRKLTNTFKELISSWICEFNPKHSGRTGSSRSTKFLRLQDAKPHNQQLQAEWEYALHLAIMFYECSSVSVISCHGSITLFSTVNGKNGSRGFSREQKVEIRSWR